MLCASVGRIVSDERPCSALRFGGSGLRDVRCGMRLYYGGYAADAGTRSHGLCAATLLCLAAVIMIAACSGDGATSTPELQGRNSYAYSCLHRCLLPQHSSTSRMETSAQRSHRSFGLAKEDRDGHLPDESLVKTTFIDRCDIGALRGMAAGRIGCRYKRECSLHRDG